MGFRFSNVSKIRRISSLHSHLLLLLHRHRPFLISSIDPESHRLTLKRWHGGHSHSHDDQGHVRGDEGVFKLGLAADIALAAGKSATGYLSGSTAIIADAAHSLSDIVLSGVAWLSFRAGKVPKDQEHPYGHGKFETLGALGISCMLLTTAGGIAWHAIHILQETLMSNPDMINHMIEHSHDDHHGHGGHHHGIDLNHPVLALSMTIVSISVKEGLYLITKRAGEREGSELMKANAWHHRADAVSSVVALIGVGGSILGVRILDPVAGIFVSGLILKAGIETGYRSVMELVDAGVPLPVLAPIKQTILQVEGVKGCHRLRGRKAGSFLYLDVHIEVDPCLSVTAAHDIGENVRREIQNSHSEVAESFIHIDPSFSHCPSMEEQRQNLKGIETQNSNSFSNEKDAEAIVSNVVSSRFAEKMTVEHITRHSPQGKILLEVQVSMPPQMSIREAKAVAREAEREIMKAAPFVDQVRMQLRLGSPIQQLHSYSNGNGNGKI